jgi:hypothetical protein
MRPARPSFPGSGTICITWTEGAIEVGMSVRRPGSEAFITPSCTCGSGGSAAERCMAPTASARERAARSIGFAASARA